MKRPGGTGWRVRERSAVDEVDVVEILREERALVKALDAPLVTLVPRLASAPGHEVRIDVVT